MLYVDDVWIVVCDASRALFYKSQGKVKPLLFIKKLEHEESRSANKDLTSDREGRTNQSVSSSHQVGKASRSGLESGNSAKSMEHKYFAREVCREIYQGAQKNDYAKLVLVASPHFLGLLREELTEQVQRMILGTITKDYTLLSPEELQERLMQEYLI